MCCAVAAARGLRYITRHQSELCSYMHGLLTFSIACYDLLVCPQLTELAEPLAVPNWCVLRSSHILYCSTINVYP
jgi:hypothetical protein